LDPDAAARIGDRRMGLVGMRERALLIGGEFETQSSPGTGTALFLRFPLRCLLPGLPPQARSCKESHLSRPPRRFPSPPLVHALASAVQKRTPEDIIMNTTTRDAEDFRAGADRIVDTVSDITENAGSQVKKLAQDAADGVRRTADYVRDSGVNEIGGQIKAYLKANPSHALIGAAVAGFLLGRLMARD
jgi:ElaB/YqjD/DUF883 family membrane-anchored ribosome-binding protein